MLIIANLVNACASSGLLCCELIHSGMMHIGLPEVLLFIMDTELCPAMHIGQNMPWAWVP